jgi:putative hemolysin
MFLAQATPHVGTGNPASVDILISILLLLGSAFFVGGEYAVVSMRRAKLEAGAKKGDGISKRLLAIQDDLSPFIAGTQIGITMVSVAMGSITEPFVEHLLQGAFGDAVPKSVSGILSFVLVLFFLVTLGELVPKYVALTHPESFMRYTYRPLELFVKVFSVVIWLAQKLSQFLLKPLGIDIKAAGKETVERDELLMMVQATGSEGILEKEHAAMVTRALRLDALAARDIMVHRLDIKWLDASLSSAETLSKISNIRYTRIPVCRGDVDDIIGIAYVVDILRAQNNANFSLEKICRPLVAIPENLSMERIVQTMREQKTQILIVLDEYGGTSGLISLEDVVEEVFGELEDGPESERPPIEQYPSGRVSARAEVRVDELISKLGLNLDLGEQRETLATMIVNRLERIPRPGDTVETDLGVLRVENMARRRITRVGIQLKDALLQSESAEG